MVLLLPGCGHFYVENMHLLPWQGAIEHLWSNLAFKRAIIACAWPVAGQAGSPPAWMLPDGAAWTKAVYTMEILALLQATKSDVSPHISLPTYLIGFGLWRDHCLPDCSLRDPGELSSLRVWPPLSLSNETLLVRGHLSRWAQLQARVSGGPFARGCSTG